MMSFRTYIWCNSVATAAMLCVSGVQLWLYCSGYGSLNGWVVLLQGASSVACAAMIPLTYRRTRRRMEQAKADATLPQWRAPSRHLDW